MPSYPSGRKQKTVVFGDKGYVEQGDISFICFDTSYSYVRQGMVFPGFAVEKRSLRKGWKDLCSCLKSGIKKRLV